MKKTIVTLMLLSGVAMADTTLLDMDFTALTGNSNDNLPAGWATGQWNGANTPHFNFGDNGAVVNHPWKQNYLYTEIELSSQADATITFTLYNQNTENTGNMFYLSSDTYSLVIGNSYNDYAKNDDGSLKVPVEQCNKPGEIYVGYLDKAVGADSDFVNFQVGTKTNPTVISGSTDFDASGTIEYTLTLSGGNMLIEATGSTGSSWSYSLEGMENVTFDTLGFIADGSPGTVGVQNVTVTIPEPTTATLSLLALAGLAARRRRK